MQRALQEAARIGAELSVIEEQILPGHDNADFRKRIAAQDDETRERWITSFARPEELGRWRSAMAAKQEVEKQVIPLRAK